MSVFLGDKAIKVGRKGRERRISFAGPYGGTLSPTTLTSLFGPTAKNVGGKMSIWAERGAKIYSLHPSQISVSQSIFTFDQNYK